MNDAIAIVCARIHSRRLPGKAMRLIAGRPAIEHIIRRLKKTGIPIVVAMPHGDGFELPGQTWEGVAIYRGEDDSPLHRMAGVLQRYKGAQYAIRVTCDDIILDPETILSVLGECKKTSVGYGISPGIVKGAGAEVIHRDNILFAANKHREPTEFISYFVKGDGLPNPNIVKVAPRASVLRDFRLEMDYPEDAYVLEAVLRAVGPDASLDDIVAYIDRNPEVMRANRLPELSIYTCAHNASSWISRNLSTVWDARLHQSIEHIVVEDCSSDETLTHLLANSSSYTKLVVNERNLGLASSSNIALGECRGKYVMRLDADDYLINDGLRNAWPEVRRMLLNGHQVVYLGYVEDRDGRWSEAKDPSKEHHAGGAVFDKAFLNELRFRDGLRHWDGKELLKRMREVGAKIGYHQAPVWAYRIHDGSMSRRNQDERFRIAKELGV